jgi:hypothetical protein
MAKSTDAIRNELTRERKYVLQFMVHIYIYLYIYTCIICAPFPILYVPMVIYSFIADSNVQLT